MSIGGSGRLEADAVNVRDLEESVSLEVVSRVRPVVGQLGWVSLLESGLDASLQVEVPVAAVSAALAARWSMACSR